MNDNHQRHLLVTFRHIDNLLSEAERVLATAGSASPFAECTQDSTPVQRKVIHDYLQRVREAMAHAMADLSLPRPAPICGALWAARGHISFASIAVAEMEPQGMRGYGALSEADAKAIDGVVAELNAAPERLVAYLAKGPDADLQARLHSWNRPVTKFRCSASWSASSRRMGSSSSAAGSRGSCFRGPEQLGSV